MIALVLVGGCSGAQPHRVRAHAVSSARSVTSSAAGNHPVDTVAPRQPLLVAEAVTEAADGGRGGAGGGLAAPQPEPTARGDSAGAGAPIAEPTPDEDAGVDERANESADASVGAVAASPADAGGVDERANESADASVVAVAASPADASAYDASGSSARADAGYAGPGTLEAGMGSDDDAGADSLLDASTEPQGAWASAWSRAWLSTTGMPAARPAQFDNQTLRLIVWPTLGGSRVRVKFTNAYATTPLRVGAAHVALRQSEGTIAGDTDRVLSFDGMPSVTIAAGAEAWSDPVALDVAAHDDVAISVYLPDTFEPQSFHPVGLKTSYLSSAGDHTASITMPAPTAGSKTTAIIFFAAELQVHSSAVAPAQIVALGDSITDGYCSTIDANGAWPDLLSKRLTALADGTPVGIINAGISSNRLVASDVAGVRGIDRLVELLEVPGVRWVLLLEGVNDISYEHATSADLIAAYKRAIAMAHAAQIKIFGVPLLPIAHSVKDTPDNQATRSEVNTWIRSSGAYDAVLDFEQVLGDPADPGSMRSDLTCDHVHPNPAGYEAMATAIDLSLFR